MTAACSTSGARTIRTALNVGRLVPRLSRHAVREHRARSSRPRLTSLVCDGGIRLVPATIHAAGQWQELLERGPDRPPSTGIAASSLGGRPGGRSEWIQACLDLNAAARRGTGFAYLVFVHDYLVGEVLAFVDGGTAAADVVCWLEPGQPADVAASTVELLSTHLFYAPDPPQRAIVTVPESDLALADALARRGFHREGVLNDPPRPARVVMVAYRTAPAMTDLA